MSSPAPPPVSRSRKVRVWLTKRLTVAAVGYLAVVGMFKLLENRLVYPGLTAAQDWLEPPTGRFRDLDLASVDGTPLHAWWLPPDDPAHRGAVLFCHGNGGNLSHRGEEAVRLRAALGRGVLLFDYPGYGKCGGQPTEAGCYAAADAAYRWLTAVQGVPPGEVVIAGESLGGGVAVELASRVDHRALVLVKTFTSMPAAAKANYPYLPTFAMMSNRYDSLSRITGCRRPVFVAHGDADRTVPYPLGEQLFVAANEPKRFLTLPGQDHNDHLGDEFYPALREFLDRNP